MFGLWRWRGRGHKYNTLQSKTGLQRDSYHGIEWNESLTLEAQQKGLNVTQGDLNKTLPFEKNSFDFGLSILELLLIFTRSTPCLK